MAVTNLSSANGEIKMMRFACKDLGLDCDFAVTGDTKEEVMQKAMQHGGIAHAAMMQGMTQEQMDQFAKQLEAAIKPI
jgi:predicted small metal-binding protein